MKPRESVVLVVLVPVLFTLALVVNACGGEKATTSSIQAAVTSTQAATTTATAAPATTTESSATTATTAAAGSVTLPSLQMTPELQAYIQQMQTWAGALDVLPSADDPLLITDLSEVTDVQVKAAEAFATAAHGALDQLKAIKPPAEVAALQESLISALSSEVDATDKAVQALRSKDQAMLDAAIAESGQLESQWEGLMDSLESLLTGGTPAS
jgi:hypothetical protein